jgi:hypothetical protein
MAVKNLKALEHNVVGALLGRTMFGLDGNDILVGDADKNVIFGGTGDDRVLGNAGRDNLFGDAGNDGLSGGADNDHLFGGAGRDFIVGGAGTDELVGGEGNDKFVIRSGTGVDRIADLGNGDRIDLRSYDVASVNDVMTALQQQGDNVVLTLPGGDTLIIQDKLLADIHAEQFIVSSAATGPSSSQSPYVLGVLPEISTVSLLTAGDTVGLKVDGVTPWRMVGIPDGLGAFDNGDGTFTVLMNQELGNTSGVIREHGAKGAFISELIIDKTTLQVVHAEDLVKQFHMFDAANDAYVDGSPALNRFCSADLAAPTAFYNAESGLGYNGGRIFLNGEESGNEGRAFAHIASGDDAGNSYELGWLGNMAFENVVANPNSGDKTVVAMMDDGNNGQVYFYIGDKQSTGSAIDMAGLTHGSLFGVKVDGLVDEANGTTLADGTHFSLFNLGDVNDLTGAQIDGNSETAGITSFLRPEDGAWDTIDPDRFYFVTTNGITAPSRLWALDFDDSSHPELGGTITMLLDGTEGQKMMDNITVDRYGHVIIQEDVGNNVHLGKVWDYDPTLDQLTMIAQHDPSRFLTGGSNFLTQDEESSGVIDVTDILGSAGQTAYLLDVQAHYPNGTELAEGGQLLVMYHDMV